MSKVVLTSFFFYYISRTRTGYHFAPLSTRLLYLYFIWNPKNSLLLWHSGYRVGLRGFDGRGFDSNHRKSYFSVPDFFLITIFMIFFPS